LATLTFFETELEKRIKHKKTIPVEAPSEMLKKMDFQGLRSESANLSN
jgi:hypothetical protein